MVLNHCTICAVYESDIGVSRRIPVRCVGERITLLLKREQELENTARIRIDFFDSQIGCIKTYCELIVRKNYDRSIAVLWVADCEILEVIEITQDQRTLRARMEKEVLMNSFAQGEFQAVVQNIGEGGLYFVTKTRLKCEDTITFSYCFVEKEYPLKAAILREEDLRDGRYGYGCQFLELSKDARRGLQQYIYLRQQGKIW